MEKSVGEQSCREVWERGVVERSVGKKCYREVLEEIVKSWKRVLWRSVREDCCREVLYRSVGKECWRRVSAKFSIEKRSVEKLCAIVMRLGFVDLF